MPNRIVPLKKRAEFLAVAAQRKRWVAPAFIVQIAPCEKEKNPDKGWGVGLTASKKMVGMAVDRNRARRRLRALAHAILPACATPEYDYIFIARREILKRSYADLRTDLEKALKRLGLWREGA